MVFRRFFLMTSVLAAAFLSFTETIAARIDRAIAIGLAWLGIDPGQAFQFAAGPTLALDSPGQAIDPALMHSLRHEAGVPRRAAPRHC